LPELVAVLVLAVLVMGGFWLVTQRLERLERRIRELPRASEWSAVQEALQGRLGALEQEVGRGREDEARRQGQADSLSTSMSSLHEHIQALEKSLGELAQQVEQMARRQVTSRAEDAAADPLSDSLIRHLEHEGYGQIRVLSDLESADPLEEHRVPVEARRAGVAFKGLVTLFEGRVADVALRPSYEAFP